jgi:hypothetical protein
LKKKIKDATRKPQGCKAFRTRKQAKYHNWFTPFVFKKIENARIAAGGPNWSTRAIEHELIKMDPVVFKDFRQQTLDEWIDHSQVKPRWSDKTLARIKRGNDIGHANGGRKGALVSPFVFNDSIQITNNIPGKPSRDCRYSEEASNWHPKNRC